MGDDNPVENSVTDAEWRRWGSQNPYRGVLGVDTESVRDRSVRSEFFRSGEQHVQRVLRAIQVVAPQFQLSDADVLEFGCGVGRVMVPFADRARSVSGVDVSDAMIREATKNLAGRKNVSFYSGLKEIPTEIRYDLVHSHLVLQHIRPRQGVVYMGQLLERVRTGGCFAIQITLGSTNFYRSTANWMRYRFPLLHYAYNLARRRPVDEPISEMNSYDLLEVLAITQSRGFGDCVVFHHGSPEYRGLMLIGYKEAERQTL